MIDDRDRDAVEGRIRAPLLDCWACARAAKRGALHLSGKALVRDATAHLIGGPGNQPLCERRKQGTVMR